MEFSSWNSGKFRDLGKAVASGSTECFLDLDVVYLGVGTLVHRVVGTPFRRRRDLGGIRLCRVVFIFSVFSQSLNVGFLVKVQLVCRGSEFS